MLQVQGTHLAYLHMYPSKETIPRVKVRLILFIVYSMIFSKPCHMDSVIAMSLHVRKCLYFTLSCYSLFTSKSFFLRTLEELFHCFLEYHVVIIKSKVILIFRTLKFSFESIKELSFILRVLKFRPNVDLVLGFYCCLTEYHKFSSLKQYLLIIS